MLTFTWKDVLVAEQRQKDMVAQAEQARETHSATENGQGIGFGARWLVVLGERLVSWGCRLQARYSQALLKGNTASRCESTAMRTALPRHI